MPIIALHSGFDGEAFGAHMDFLVFIACSVITVINLYLFFKLVYHEIM
jgi:hypothetical protein